MKTPHLCWVVEPPASFEPLVRAAEELGLRVGWLSLSEFTPSPELDPARRAGLTRSVAVGGGGTLSLRSHRGEPVLEDLIRSHFLGCSLVLLSGDPSNPGVRVGAELAPARLWRVRPPASPGVATDGECWRLVRADGSERRLDTGRLAARLRRPRI